MTPGQKVQGAVLAVLVAFAMASGCGGEAGIGMETGAPPPSPPGTSGIQEWGMAVQVPDTWTITAGAVEDLRARDDDHGLVVDAVVPQVRLADGSCAGEVGGWIEDEGNPELVWVSMRSAVPNVSLDPRLDLPRLEHGACPDGSSTIELTMDAPLGGRDVMTDGVRWVPGASGAPGPYVACQLPGCDPATGEAPVTGSCADRSALVDDIRTLGDVGMHAGIAELRCEGTWAMVEVDIGAGACPPADGGPNPCAGQRVDRLFLRAGTPHWQIITRTREAGCGPVTSGAPDFPVALCEDLPALTGG